MDKTNVIRVVHFLTEQQVNAALDLGWRIIETASGCDEGDAYILYSLGWDKPTAPPDFPSAYDKAL